MCVFIGEGESVGVRVRVIVRERLREKQLPESDGFFYLSTSQKSALSSSSVAFLPETFFAFSAVPE